MRERKNHCSGPDVLTLDVDFGTPELIWSQLLMTFFSSVKPMRFSLLPSSSAEMELSSSTRACARISSTTRTHKKMKIV